MFVYRKIRRLRTTGCVLAGLLAVLLAPAVVLAQLPTGAIRGAVTDIQSAALPGATVTVTHRESGVVRSMPTNAAGAFRLAGLPSGTYEIAVQIPQFQKQSRVVTVTINQDVEVNFALALEARVEEVTVTAEVSSVETTTSEISRTFNAAQIRELPLPGRNFLNLILTMPGAVAAGTGAAGFGVAVNGQRPRNINFVIDGSDNNDASVPNPRSPIMQDAVGDLRVLTSVFAAEVGRNSGGVALASTKTGTNQFRGTAYEFYENAEKLNARDNLELAAKFPRAGKLRRDTHGFTLGGPLQQNRTFFFTGFQRIPFEGAGAAAPISSPTQEGRQRLAAVPGADPVMAQLLDAYIPLPNSGTERTVQVAGQTIPLADYVATLPNESDNRQVILRVDHHFKGQDHVFARYLHSKTEAQTASNPPGFGFDTLFPTHNLVGTWNRVVGSSGINELHYSYGRTEGLFPASQANPTGNSDLPTIALTSFFTIGVASTFPQGRREFVHQITDSFSWLENNHAFKAGADVRWVNLSADVPFDFRGTYTYSNLTQFMTNRPFSVLKAYGEPGPEFDYLEAGYFLQDDWKVGPRLTLNLGLRYERTGASGGFYSNVATDNNNVGPRTGFAWDLSGSGKTVVRGGYARTYDQLFLNIPLLAFQAPPFQRRITDATAAFRYPTVPADRAITPAELLTLGITDIPDDAQLPIAHQWQLSLQRQLGSRWRTEVAYVGSLGRHLIRQRVDNPFVCCPRRTVADALGRPATLRHGDPLRTGGITVLEPEGKSEFHSGQFSIERRLANNFAMTASYTWSRFYDDNSESLATGAPTNQRPQNNFDFASEWARSAWDRPHRFVATWIYELPWWRAQQGALGHVLGGWQVAGSWAAQSGQPFTIVNGVDSNGDGDGLNDRPDINPGGDPKTVGGYILRPQFAGGNGTLDRNTGRGPYSSVVNTIFSKSTRVGQSQVQFRAEVFNLLNRRNHSLRNNALERNLSNPSQFMDFTTSNGGSRTIVLGLKYLF